ncbi:MAG: SDR family NAD(P)-dependent oxidoreductase, partial [Propionibacteriales bacterium]|nr:SDR family NAD(P)-dependent oxidoreductase [Propionibacteriales bacterium]
MDRATADVRALDVPSDAPLALPLAGADRDAVRALALGVRRAVVDGQLGDLRALGAALAAQVAAPVPDGHRAVLVLDAGATHEDLLEVLEALVAGRPDPRLVQGEPRRDPGATALVFPGQGAQWPGMGSLLREQSPVFDEAMARSLSVVAEEHPAWPDDALDSVERLRAVEVVQPALFAVQTSLAELWRAHGVEVDLVVGHSIGELAAAQVAGAFSPADGARAAARWSRAMMPLVGVGDMASVGLALDDVRARLARWQDPDLEVAGVNGPTSVLLAGDPATVRTRVAQLRDEGVRAQVIAVEMAAHSRQVDAVAADLAAAFTGLEPAPLDLPFVSSVAGGRVEGPYLTGAHWARCFREPVRYDRAVEVALAEGAGTFVEVSPHPVLAAVTRQVVEAEGSAAQVVSTLQRDVGGLGRFLHSLAQVWVGGTAVDWSASCSDVEPSAVPVPAPLGDLPRTDGGLAQDGRGPAPSAPHDVVAVVRAEAATVAGRAVRSDETFLEMGLDSVLVAQLRTQLAAALGRDLPITWFYDFPTPGALGDALAGAVDRPAPHRPAPASRHDDEPIAVVAMACRLPGGVATPEDFWEVLSGGRDVVDGLPADRGWDVAALLHPDTTRSGTTVQRSGGFLRAVADFDPAFFGLSPREALAMDPQQRVLLELSWEVLERAGIAPDSLRATRTGVFVGLIPQEYGPRLADGGRGVEGYLMTGTTSSVASGRIAYTLGLEGPALTVDTACSSSLAAVHLACASLRRGETPLALVGGATIMPTPGMLVDFSRMGSLAPDGRSKAFSAAADGFGMAEGAGMVVLERLSDARRHGHPVLAVVRGTAMNSDGASNGLSAPNGRAQVRVVRDALADAGIAAADVDVVEAHGTGTRLGDPIEASALQDAYGDGRQRPLLLGSVKSNIGHTQAAAGVVGLMKLVLALNHDVVPPTLHAAEPSTEIDWSKGVLELVHRPTPWQRGERPRRAGVSSFGISGTNVHAVLEEAPGPASSTTTSHRGPAAFPWVLSGASREAVGAQAARLADHLEAHPQLDPVDVAHTLATGRSPLGHRVGLVSSPDRVVESLRAVADGTSGAASGVVDGVARPVFVFPGQGWQWAGMAVELLDTTPVFAQAMRECARALRPHLDLDVVEFLRTEAAHASSAGALSTERVDHVQPVLFAVMVSLAATWRAQGVEPAAVVGHSQGEIAAACVAGLLTLEDAARIVARRSLAIAAMPRRGAMVSIAAPLEEVRARLGDRLDVASVNSPSSVVVAGDRDVLDLLVAECAADGIRTTRLPVDYASHSRHVDDIEGEVLEGLSPAPRPLPGAVPMLSTVTGRWVEPGDLGPRYWFDNLRSTVRFSDAVQSLVDGGWETFVEISAHPILTTAVEQTAETDGHDVVTISTLRRGHGGPDELASSLARAFVAGVPVDWRETFRGSGAVPVQLPTYPFERRRVWWSPSSGDGAGAAPPDPRSYRIAWHPGAIDPHARLRGTWVLLHRPDLKQSFLATAEEALARRGARVERWAVPPGGAEQEVAAGLEGTSDVTGMVSLLAVDASEDAGSPLSSPVIDDLLGAVRAVVASDSSARLWWVTSGAVATSPHERLRTLGHGASWAIGRIVGLENPTVWGGLMDLPGIDAEDAVAQLGAVLAADDGEDHLALRLSGPWVRRWVRVTTPATQQWRPRGTVLVTGATGGVGRQVARWLASRGAQRLVLLSRRGPQAEGAGDLVRELEVAGAQVDLRACDVADRDALEQVLSDIGDDLPLSSVFHAAATLDDAVVTELTAERIERSNRAKVLGALHLDALTRDVELDDFVLFSSFASAFGTPGLGGYAPGNAVLDALAHERRRVGRPAVSVSWGTWAGGGMAEGPVAERFRRHGVLQMDPRDATASLVSALDRADAAPLVMEIEWRRFVAAYTALRPTRLFDDLAERGPDAVQAARTADEPARGGRPADRDAVTALVRDRVADVLGHESADAIDVDQPFARLGVDSLSALELRNALGATTGVRLPTTIVFDHPTVRRLAAHLAEQLGLSEQSVGPERESVERDDEDPIVVVGMGCRLPGGVDGPESLWDLVVDGATTATDAPDDRSWTVEELARGGVARGNFMDGAGDFDAAFFGISPREALAMDPQQRHALQSVWETLEHAGIAPDSLRGTRTGVFVGHSHQGYGTGAVQDGGDLEGYRLTGTTASVVSGRVAYVLGLEGPAITVDTACSSSLVALHLAVGALRSGECDLAVAGGVSVMAGPEVFVEFSRQGALAADGRCKPFS